MMMSLIRRHSLISEARDNTNNPSSTRKLITEETNSSGTNIRLNTVNSRGDENWDAYGRARHKRPGGETPPGRSHFVRFHALSHLNTR